MNNEMMENIRKKIDIKKLTVLKAVKFYCRDMCCASDMKSWLNCTFTACFLHKYRLGKLSGMFKQKSIKSLIYKDLKINDSKKVIENILLEQNPIKSTYECSSILEKNAIPEATSTKEGVNKNV